MPYYRVPIRIVNTEVWIVKANNREEAIDKACDGNGDIQEEIEGDADVHYHDVSELKEDSLEVEDYKQYQQQIDKLTIKE